MWDGDRIGKLADLAQDVSSIIPTDIGLMIELADGELQLLDPTGAKAPRRLLTASTRAARVQQSGRMVIGTGSADQLLVLELPSLARWELPVVFQASDMLVVAPNARRVIQGSLDRVMLWELPLAGSDFSAWLDELTNATMKDDLLAWPWQTRP